MTEKNSSPFFNLIFCVFIICQVPIWFYQWLFFLITESGEKLVFLGQIIELSTYHYLKAHASWLPCNATKPVSLMFMHS